jgi:hypothetical protein
MKNNFKLEGVPPIYYFNLDHRKDRKNYIENHFLEYGITNYFRVPSSRYSVSNYDQWKDSITSDGLKTKIWFLATLIDRIHGILQWYKSGISETCLVVEDDICFDTSKYWKFDWKTFENKLPINWECIQLHIIGEKFVRMHLSKWSRNNHSTGCMLINRSFAEKLLKFYFKEGKFVLHSNYGYSKKWPEYHYQSVDFVMYQVGITYSIPLFTTNYNFISDGYRNGGINQMSKNTDIIVKNWWEKESHNYDIDDIIYLDSQHRKKMTLTIDHGLKK